MLADVLAWINGHYLTLLLMMLAGACFLFAGMLCIFIVRRRDVLLGEPDVQTFTVPATVYPPRAVKSHRADDETHVIPGIPGALPPETVAVERFVEVIDEATIAIAQMTGVPLHLLGGPGTAEAFTAIDGLRVIPSPDLGPVCPICGAPFHAVCPSAKGAPTDPFDYPPVDDCALTTGEIEIPIEGEPPIAAQVATFRNPKQETQDLTVRLDQTKERVA